MLEQTPSAPRLAYLRAQKRRKTTIHIWQASVLLAFLALWEVSTRLGWVDAFVVSSPSRVAATLCGLYRTGDLWLHLGTSCLETAAGFTLGTLLGTLVAVGLWWSDFLSRVSDPISWVNALPKTALGPISSSGSAPAPRHHCHDAGHLHCRHDPQYAYGLFIHG